MANTFAVPQLGGPPQEKRVPMSYQPYPRWIHQPLDGRKRIVQNHLQEEEATGIKMNPDGTPYVEPPLTVEQVKKAGYSQEIAERVVAEEKDSVPPAVEAVQLGQAEKSLAEDLFG